jgi:hypothetical protein
MKNKFLPIAVFLVLFGAFYRVFRLEFLPDLPNFAPLMAIAFCGGMFLPGRLAWTIPVGALLISDLFLNAHYGVSLVSWSMPIVYACYVLAVFIGTKLRGAGLLAMLGATVANAVIFYLVTNTLAWWGNPQYMQTFAGLIQSLTVGLPGFPPTWTFFRNSLAGDLIFTALFAGAFYLARNRSAEPNLCRQESSL